VNQLFAERYKRLASRRVKLILEVAESALRNLDVTRHEVAGNTRVKLVKIFAENHVINILPEEIIVDDRVRAFVSPTEWRVDNNLGFVQIGRIWFLLLDPVCRILLCFVEPTFFGLHVDFLAMKLDQRDVLANCLNNHALVDDHHGLYVRG
jgi:hypothetical protein